MGSATRALMPPKARILGLMEEVGRLEAKALATAPIDVYRVARCGHADCGCPPPDELPMDALVIEMGCQYEIPSVTPPEGMEQGYRSRVEKQAEGGVGRGLGPEGVKRTIQMIQMLQR